MLSHWYNHDNLGNSLKANNMNTLSKLDPQNFLKVPDSASSAIVIPPQYAASNTSINSLSSKNTNLRDSPCNFRIPWKIVLMGDAGVGKTSLIKQFLSCSYNPNYNPTVEDSYLHNIALPDGLNQCVEILDTSGYYQFPAMRELNIKLGTAFILVFDLSKEESFNSALELRQTVINIKGTDNLPIIIVGNKSDEIKDPHITKKVNSLINENNRASYIETSAKENRNVAKLFNSVVDQIVKEMEESIMANNATRRNSSVSIARRISISKALKQSDPSRRYSEPAQSDGPNAAKAKTDSNQDKDSASSSSSRRKQKNCAIS